MATCFTTLRGKLVQEEICRYYEANEGHLFSAPLMLTTLNIAFLPQYSKVSGLIVITTQISSYVHNYVNNTCEFI